MTIQTIDLNNRKTFEYYKSLYGYKDDFIPGLTGLELRDTPAIISEDFRNKYNAFTRNSGTSVFLKDHLLQLKKIISDDKRYNNVIRILTNYEVYAESPYSIGNRMISSCSVMGILNITPDSFSDGGKYYDVQKGTERGIEMLEQGADIIDIGGESTRPGSNPVPAKEELRRVIPVIESILNIKNDAVISIDTNKSIVAEAALEAGASIVNDISGLVFDEKIIDVISGREASVIIMHIKGTPADMQKNPYYSDVISEIYDHLCKQTEKAQRAGIQSIFIDPGIGFGKRIEDNFNILSRLNDFKSLGFPIVIGLSRKSFIARSLNSGLIENDNASAIAETIAVKNGAKIIRTHNVKNGAVLKELYNRIN